MGKYIQLKVIPPDNEALFNVAYRDTRTFADIYSDARGYSHLVTIEDTDLDLFCTGETMNKVFGVLLRAGVRVTAVQDIINDMQNNGIYFREPRGKTTVVKTPEEPLEKS